MTRTDSNFANPAEGHADDDFGGVHDPSFFHDGCISGSPTIGLIGEAVDEVSE